MMCGDGKTCQVGDVMQITLWKCSSCGRRHDGLSVSRLAEPESIDGMVVTHVGACPDSGVDLFVQFDGK